MHCCTWSLNPPCSHPFAIMAEGAVASANKYRQCLEQHLRRAVVFAPRMEQRKSQQAGLFCSLFPDL
jgi:hypothetical protein